MYICDIITSQIFDLQTQATMCLAYPVWSHLEFGQLGFQICLGFYFVVVGVFIEDHASPQPSIEGVAAIHLLVSCG